MKTVPMLRVSGTVQWSVLVPIDEGPTDYLDQADLDWSTAVIYTTEEIEVSEEEARP